MPNGTLEETIRGLSPEALNIFRRQLPERLKVMGELERNTILERLSKIPELAVPEALEQPPQEIPLWEKGLGWLQEQEQRFGAAVTAPFTPTVAGTERLPWMQRELAEYRAWEEPSFQVEPLFRLPWTPKEISERPWTIGVKGAVQTLPYFLIPSAAGVAGRLGLIAARGGVLARPAVIAARAIKPIVAAERAITYPIAKPLELLGKRIAAKTLPETARFIAPTTEVIEKRITQMDWQRKVAEWFGRKPFFKSITEAIGGKAAIVGRTEAVEDVTARALLVGARVQETLTRKGAVALADLRAVSLDPIRLFGVDEATGLTGIKARAGFKGASKHIDDIAESPAKYILSKEQKLYIQEVHNIEDWVLDGLKEAGVDVKLLKFDEFSHWVHRVVLGKKVDGKLVELKRGFGRIGSKQSFEKTRFYEHAADGIEQGLVYAPNLEKSVDLYIQSAAKRIGDQRISQVITPFGVTPKMRMPAPIRIAREDVVAKRLALRQMSSIIERLETGKTFAPQTWMGIKRWYPEEYAQLRAIVKGKPKAPVTPEVTKIASELENRILRIVPKLKQPYQRDPWIISLENIPEGLGDELLRLAKKKETPLLTGVRLKDGRFVRIDTAGKREGLLPRLVIEEAPVAIPKAEVTLPATRPLQGIKELIVDEQDVLKEVAKEIRPKYKLAMEIAKQPSLGTEATIWHPAFQGKIYPIEVKDAIQSYWADMGFKPLQTAATMSGAMRTLVAAADFSAPWIQGLPGIALHPKAWGNGVRLMFNSFKNPKVYQEFLIRNADDALEFANFGGYLGGFEYMEAMPVLRKAGRFAGALAGKPRIGEAAVRQSYGRFEAAFGAFGDSFRVNMWKSLKGRAKNTDELMEIARHIDRMSGVMSTKGLGIGRTQRDFETAFLFFAPRYTRAGFALVSDIFKGGLSGAEARKALGSMMAAGAAFYSGICGALGQTPNFDPSTGRFMTIEITDPMTGTTRHFGIGGMMTSLVRFGADATASALSIGMNEPLDFVKLSRVDNPFIRFMYSKSAPLTGFMTGMIEGKNFFGEPFENAGDYAKFMGEQVIPIAAQSAFMEEAGLAPTAILAEEAGMRTFPRSDWEKRNIVRDRVAQERYGMTWDDVGTRLGKLYQVRLENESPELQEATELAVETSSKMARGEGKIWNAWREEGRVIEERYRGTIMMASREIEATGDGTTFRQKVDEASAIRRAMYATRERNPQYVDIQTYFSEPLEPDVLAKMNPNDLARREYYQMMYSPDMYDQFGNYRFDEADRRETLFVQQYGQTTLDYVEEYLGARWEEPIAMKALREARNLLKPYWDIERHVWANYSPQLKQLSDQIQILERTDPRQAKKILFQYPQIMMARRMVALYRKQLKTQNPEIAYALNQFYRY